MLNTFLRWWRFEWAWLRYYGRTLNDRERYTLAQKKGCYCVRTKHGPLTILIEYDTSQPPQAKDFLDRPAFRAEWNAQNPLPSADGACS